MEKRNLKINQKDWKTSYLNKLLNDEEKYNPFSKFDIKIDIFQIVKAIDYS